MALLSDVSKYKIILFTSNPVYPYGTFTVPRDWTNNNIVEMWAAGGVATIYGGGGGGYARIHNLELNIGQVIDIQNYMSVQFGNYIKATTGNEATGAGGTGIVLPDGLRYKTFVSKGGNGGQGAGGGGGGAIGDGGNGRGQFFYNVPVAGDSQTSVALGGYGVSGSFNYYNGLPGYGGFDGTLGAGGGGSYGGYTGGQGGNYGGGGGSSAFYDRGRGGYGAIAIYYIPANEQIVTTWIS